MKKIYILVVNYKNDSNTIDFLNSLLRINTNGFEVSVVVIDNYPQKRIQLHQDDYKKINLKIIPSPLNSGFSGGMNIGIKESLAQNADYILIQNNDTIVKEDFLKEMFDFLEKNPEVGIVSPKIYFAKGYEFHKDRYEKKDLGKIIWYAGGKMDWRNTLANHRGVDEVDEGQFDQTSETDFATGCSMLVRSQVFKRIGLFDENYFLYYEDNDLSQRTIRGGFKVYFLPKSVIWHKNAGSTGGSGSDLQDYFITRNRLYFGLKYASARAKIALFREGIRLSALGRKMQKRGARDFLMGRMGRGSIAL